MASLKIYNDIVNEEDKICYQDWMGLDAICYKDITEFLEAIPEDDNEVNLRIHCAGGNVMEGWAIYDALRNSGKTITATIEGQCASMATVILLAAPKERRFATKNASMCIHNPYIPYMDLWVNENITANKMDAITAKLTATAEQLRADQKKIIDLYVERTGASAEELQSLMNEDKFVDMARAKELGFICDTLAPNTDKKHSISNNHKAKTMNKKEVTVQASVLSRMLAKLGITKVEDFKVVDLVVTAANGDELTVEREEGDTQVGDTASPDGNFVMEDGTTITVADGVITAITPKEEPTTEEGTNADDEKDAKIADLTAQVEALNQQIAELTSAKDEKDAKIADLSTQVSDLTTAQKSEDDTAILDAVAKAGGKEWLDAILAQKPTFNQQNTRFQEHNEPMDEPQALAGDTFLADMKAKAQKARW